MSLKALERRWRRVWIAGLTRLLGSGRESRASAPSSDGRPRRVLFLRPDRIGDMIASTGLLRAIARARPTTIRLDVLASPANAPVIRDDRHVERVLVLDRRRPWRWPALVWRLRAAHYDAVVDCMPTAASVTTLLLMLAAGARERIGVAGRGNDAALTVAVPPRRGARHVVEHLSALASAFGVDADATDFSPAIALAPDEIARAEARWPAPREGRRARGRRLLVNVSAGTAARRWPASSFVEVLRGVRARHPRVDVLVIGAPNETKRTALVAAHAGGLPTASTPALRDALALVATADVVLTPDTCIAHAACAFRKPAVDLLLRGRAAVWGLYGTPGFSLESPGTTLESLPAAPVLAALLDVMRATEVVAEPEAAPWLTAPFERLPAREVRSSGEARA